MALNAKVLSFAAPTATNASFSVTGAGFTPKAAIFWGNRLTADGSIADASHFIGVAWSTTDRGVVAGDTQNNLATTAAFASQDNTKCIKVMGNSATALLAADFVSWDTDGATFNFSIVDAAHAYIINVCFLGGSDLTNVHTGADTNPTATGNKSVTGFGFTPKMLWAFMAAATFTTNPNTAAASWKWGFGTGLSSTVRQAQGGGSINGVASGTTNTPSSKQNSVDIIAIPSSPSTSSPVADLTTLDADGDTLNWSTVPASARYYYYTGWGGTLQCAQGSFTQRTTGTGTQAITGMGFQPVLVLFTSWQNGATSSNSGGNLHSFGMASASTERAVTWFGDADMVATANSNSSQNLDRTKVIKFYTPGGATPTLLAAADYTSSDADGCTVNWTTNDNVGRQIQWCAFGAAASTSYSKSVSSSIAHTASVARAQVLARAPSTTIAHASPLVRVQAAPRSLASSVAPAAALARTAAFPRAQSSTIAQSATLDRAQVLTRPQSSTITPTQTVTRAVFFPRPLAATISHAAVLARSQITGRAATSTVAHTVLLDRAVAFARSLNTSATQTASLARAVVLTRALAASVAHTATTARLQVLTRALASTIGHTAAVSGARTTGSVSRALASTISHTASVARGQVLGRTQASSIAPTIGVARAQALGRSQVYAAAHSAAATRTVAFARGVATQVAPAASVARGLVLRRPSASTVLHGASAARSQVVGRALGAAWGIVVAVSGLALSSARRVGHIAGSEQQTAQIAGDEISVATLLGTETDLP